MRKAGDKKSRGLSTGRLVVGLIIIFIGVLLLLETTEIYPTRDILRYVPSLFVLLGIWVLVKSRLRTFFGPIILILFGLAWQLEALGHLTWDQITDFWPVILILIGIYFLLGRYRSRVRESDSAYTSTFAVFGDVQKKNTSKRFSGGEAAGIFSDIQLDLRDAEVGDEPARISVSVLFSDIDIIVPAEWNVDNELLPILADTYDKRRRTEDEHEEVDLIVDGVGVLSDIYVKD